MFRIFTFFIVLFCVFTKANALKPNIEKLTWQNGYTLLKFFEVNKIPPRIYYNLAYEDKELADEISANTQYWVLWDKDESLAQALIPINEELQIHIYKNKNHTYEMEFLPIEYEVEERVLSVSLTRSPYMSIIAEAGSMALAQAFVRAFRETINFKSTQKGDRLVIIYSQKRRMGKIFGTPEIKAAMVENNKQIKFAYRFENSYFDEKGRELERFFLTKPVKNARISSRFNPKRFHPILKRYRAHLGMDYAAPRGSKVYAAGDGVVSFASTKGGYGKTIIIKHASEYSTLYAHLNGFAKKIVRGKKVKQGELIGCVGNTGMSTGPHLHFGLYRDNKAINPEKIVRVVKSALSGRDKERFNELKEGFLGIFDLALKPEYENAPREEEYENYIPLM